MRLHASADGPSRRSVLKTLSALGVGSITGVGAYGYLYERHHLAVTRTDVGVRTLPAALDGLRIGLLTDTHRSETVTRREVEVAVDALVGEAPDLIVLGGDYVTWGDRSFVDDSADALSRLTAPAGVYAVLGNHDDDRDMPAALTRRGFTVLRDARTRVQVRGLDVDLVGLRYWTRRLRDVEAAARGYGPVTFLIAHDPRRLNEAAELRIPLVLAGHTHGGQVVLPGIGPIAARKFPVVAGLGYRGPTTMFVSRGVGTVYLPVRVNCPPEVAVLTLRPTTTTAA